ncbi:unnamed protein product [Mytilus coruscus]|uniref:Ig-like domain-containing protein n=1 Tax=Mytilus coruscus TaxID=42192 RepID=A0A6J8EXD3_MYTCO|nr:unnamed protein product [Mytilus coruscus]
MIGLQVAHQKRHSQRICNNRTLFKMHEITKQIASAHASFPKALLHKTCNLCVKNIGIPDVSTTPTYCEVTGSTALLRCDPNPRTSPPIQGVWWSKKTGGSTPTFRTVPINETKFSGGDLQTPSLTISDLEATDNGIYRCNVNNAKGTGHSDSQLFIGGWFKITFVL